MTLAKELEKLAALKVRGELSEEEFRKAKARLLSAEPPVESKATAAGSESVCSLITTHIISLGFGIFFGNFLYHAIVRGDTARGFVVGLIAAFLTLFVLRAIQALNGARSRT